jgi:hypothetical protein
MEEPSNLICARFAYREECMVELGGAQAVFQWRRYERPLSTSTDLRMVHIGI